MKTLKKAFVLLLVIMITVTGFGSISAQADGGGRPKKVSIEKSSMTVKAGNEFEIKAKVSPKNADDDYVKWEIVSGKKYVAFDDGDRSGDDIEFKAKKAGKAKIRCYIKGKNKKKYGDTITVIVKKNKSNGSYDISRVGDSTKTVEIGDDFDLEIKKGSSIKDSQLKWTIDDTGVVQFDDNNRLGREVEFRAGKIGTTNITCTCTNKKAKTKKITYTIKVVPDSDDHDD